MDAVMRRIGIGRVGNGFTLALLSGILALAVAAPARGATTIGETFAPPVGSQQCPAGWTFDQQASTSNRYVVPAGGGVITSWSYQAIASSVPTLKFKVFRQDPNLANMKTIAASTQQTPAPSGVRTFLVRIPVQAGDLIGATYVTQGVCGDISPGETLGFSTTDTTVGATTSFSGFNDTKLDLSAQLEADGDADEFGDESQDNCVGLSNPAQTNTDNDTQGDACDTDDDNDNVLDGPDECETGVTGPGNDPDGDGCKNVEDLDDDNDTVPDTGDNCSTVANLSQTNTDGDTEGDACDADDDNDNVLDGPDECETGIIGPGNDLDGDGCKNVEDLDDDGDTVADTSDNCALAANTDQANADGDAEGNACDSDDDNDGVADATDACPVEAGSTADGCPVRSVPDTTAPDIRINSGPSGKTKDTTPTFAFSSSDGTARFTCSVDGASATACTSPFTTKKLKKGKHTFSVIATDPAGNASAPASQSFTVKKKKKRNH